MPDLDAPSEAYESRDLQLITTRLVEVLGQPQIESEISSVVESELKRFDHVRVRDFVPVFVERRLRADLCALARA
jgi:hypothetical protein